MSNVIGAIAQLVIGIVLGSVMLVILGPLI